MANVQADKIQLGIELDGEPVSKTIKDLQKDYRVLNKEIRELPVGSDKFVAKSKRLAEVKQELDEARAAARAAQEELNSFTPGSINDLTKRARALKQELNDLDPTTEAFIKKGEELRKVEVQLANAQEAASAFKQEVNSYNPSSIKAMKERAKQLREEIERLDTESEEFIETMKELKKVEQGIEDAESSTDSWIDKLAEAPGPIGSIGKALKSALAPLFILTLIGELINLASEVFNVTQEFQVMREEVNRLTGATGNELNKFTAEVASLGETFNVEVNDVLKSANATSKQFGENFGDVLQLMEKGFLAVGNEADEFLEQIKEYGPQFKQAGFTAEQSFALIASSINSGVYLDAGADAVKEFNLRIKDLSTEQAQTMENILGKEMTNRIVEGVETGKMTSIEAMREVSKEIENVGTDSADAQKLISALFGGPGENAGAEFIAGLQDVRDSLDEVVDTSNIYVQRMIEQKKLNDELKAAQNKLSVALDGTGHFFSSLGKEIKTGFYKTITDVFNFFKYIPDQLRVMTSSWQGFVNKLISGAEWLLKNGLSPLIWAIEKITGKELKLPRLKVPPETLEAEKALQDKIAADRAAFAKEQERQSLLAAEAEGAADRKKRLEEARRTSRALEAEAKKKNAAMAKLQEEADRSLQRLSIEVMEEGIEKQIALATFQSEERKRALKGNAETIAAQQNLIEQKLAQDIQRIREQETTKEINQLKESAEERLKALDTSAEDYSERKVEIEQELAQEIHTVLRSAEQEEKTLLEQQYERRKAMAMDSSEEIQSELVRIERETREAIKSIKEDESLEASTQETKIAKLREQEQLRKEVLTNLTQATTQELIRIETEAQEEIRRINLAVGVDEAQKTQRIQQVQEELEERKSLLILSTQELQQLDQESQATVIDTVDAAISSRVTIEKELTQQLLQLRKDRTAQELQVQKNVLDISKTETEKAYEEQVRSLEAFMQQKQLIATQDAVTNLQDGEDEKAVQQDLQNKLLQIEQEFLQRKKELRDQFGLESLDSQKELEKLRLDITKERIDQEQAAEEAAMQAKQQRFDNVMAALGQAVEAFSNLSQARLDEELGVIEKNKQAELKAAGDNEKKKRQIEERYAKDREQAEQRAARRQKAIAVAQTIINTAQSIVKTGAQLGYPAAIPFQVIAGIVGATQLAAIAAQPLAEGGLAMTDGMNYYYQGQKLHQRDSFVDGGNVRKGSIGIIGEAGPEWVMPNWMLEHPVYGRIADSLEQVRSRGQQYSSQTDVPVFNTQTTTYASGGHTSSVTHKPVNFTHFYSTVMAQGGKTINTTPTDSSVQATQQQQNNNAEIVNLIKQMVDKFETLRFVGMVTEKTSEDIVTQYNELQARRGSTGL